MKRMLRPRQIVRILRQDGQLNVLGMDQWYSYWRDPYHLLLIMPWSIFLSLVAVGYIVANALFALAYIAAGDGIANARPGNFQDAFFFSVQTMASIGYGAMYPRSGYVNALVAVESLVGLMGLAIGTGLMFARFSRPTARVVFSRVAVITPYDGVPTLMFRAANKRRNQILEAQIQVGLARDEINSDGEFMRRIYNLKLVRSQNPVFFLTWMAMHPIDENSPLYGVTPETLAAAESMFIVTLTGIDETVSQTIHARHSYTTTDMMWNMRFADIIIKKPNGQRYIDYRRFHDVLPLGKGIGNW